MSCWSSGWCEFVLRAYTSGLTRFYPQVPINGKTVQVHLVAPTSLKVSATCLFFRTIQYVSCQFRCHFQPRFVPSAFASMYLVAVSADRGCKQCGHRGEAPLLKTPPHSQGRKYGSSTAGISCWPQTSFSRDRFGMRLSQGERIAVIPHESQYAYEQSPNPQWHSQ